MNATLWSNGEDAEARRFPPAAFGAFAAAAFGTFDDFAAFAFVVFVPAARAGVAAVRSGLVLAAALPEGLAATARFAAFPVVARAACFGFARVDLTSTAGLFFFFAMRRSYRIATPATCPSRLRLAHRSQERPLRRAAAAASTNAPQKLVIK